MGIKTNDTRELIMKMAVKLFAEKGYHQTSMETIARKAGLGKGTLYWHFSGKQELFNSIISELTGKLFDLIEEVVEDDRLNPDEKLREIISIKLKFVVENLELSRIIINNIQFTNEDFKDILLLRHKENIQRIARVIEEGINKGCFRPGPTLKIAAAFLGMINGMHSLIIDKHKDFLLEGKATEDLVDFWYNLFMHGIKINGGEGQK